MAITPTERNLPPQVSGDDVKIPIEVEEDGSAKDISNWEFGIDLEKLDDGDETKDYNATETNHDDATNGKTSIEIPATDSDTLGGDYAYDLYYVDNNGKRKTYLYGTIKFVAPAAER